MINKTVEDFQYNSGDLVYIILTPDKSVENKFKKSGHKVCRTLSHLQNCGSSQLPFDNIRWKNIKRLI